MLLDKQLLDEVSAQAKSSPRLRKNFNLHKSLDDKVQRLFNAMEPGTIIPIQRHKDTAETIIVIRGSLKLFIYDEDGDAVEEHLLNPCQDAFGYHIPQMVWHSVEILESGTVMFEVKEGPYAPIPAEDLR